MYDVYIDSLPLPFAPAKIVTKINGANKTVELIEKGQVNILKNPDLTTISFDFTIPNSKYPFVKNFLPSIVYLEKLENLITSRKPFRLIIARSNSQGSFQDDTNMLVSLEGYDIVEDAKDGLDIVVSVEFKKYVPFGTKTAIVEIKKDTQNQKKATIKKKSNRTSKSPAKSYKVKKGDNLWSICKKELGDGSKYKEVAKKNGIKNPKKIKLGQIIKF